MGSGYGDLGGGGGPVTSASITDGEIVNADINASAAIAFSKMATITAYRYPIAGSDGLLTAGGLYGDANGNVGIGSAPTSGFALDVKATLNSDAIARVYGSTASVILFDTNATSGKRNYQWRSDTDIFSSSLVSDDGNSWVARDIITLDASGYVGIGLRYTGGGSLEAATARLDVRDINGADVAYFGDARAMAADQGARLQMGGMYSTAQAAFAAIKGCKENGTNNNYAGYFAIQTRIDGGALTNRFRITSGGNVLIGALTAAGADALGTLVLSNAATAPSASADMCHLYAADLNGAGTAGLAIWQEEAVAADAAAVSTHSVRIAVNGTVYKFLVKT